MLNTSFNTPARLFNFNNLPPTEGLIAAWNLANVNDNFSTNHLTNNNAATFVAGKIGNAVNLDGVNQYLSIVDNANISFGVGKKFGFYGWIRPDTLPAVAAAIFSKYNAAAHKEYAIELLNTGAILFAVSPDGAAQTNLTTSAGIISAGVFNFLSVWYDGKKLYIEINANDTIYATPYTGDIFNGTSELRIGNEQGTAGFFDGLIDAVRLYKHDNRVLTVKERSALYNNGLGREYVSNSIVLANEVNRELNQLISIFDGSNQEVTPKIAVDSDSSALSVNQVGTGPIALFNKSGVTVAEIKNDGVFKSNLATGTAPITLVSAADDFIANLNVDLLDGLHATDYLQANSKLVYNDGIIFQSTLVLTSKNLILSGETIIGLYARARIAASSNSVVKFELYQKGFGDFATDTLIDSIILPNNINVAFKVVNNVTVVVSRWYKIVVAILSGTTPPTDTTVGVITKKGWVTT